MAFDAQFFIISVFIAGLLSFFSPCLIPLLPVYVGALSGGVGAEAPENSPGSAKSFRINRRLIIQTLLFVAGLSTAFVLLGFGAGMLGQVIGSREFLWICGIMVIVLGIHQTGLLRLNILEREKKLELPQPQSGGFFSSYLLGFTFSLGWTPCVGPVLASVLLISSNSDQIFYGAALMLIYALGLAAPFCLVSLFTDYLLRVFKKIRPHFPLIRLLGGVLIIVMGVMLLTGNLNFSAGLTNAESQWKTNVRADAPEIDFTLSDVQGNTVHLADFAGKKVYIRFWASWCSICLAGLDEFAEFAAEKSSAGDITVLTIVSPDANGEMSAADFKDWFAGRGYDFTVLLDEGGKIAKEYGVRAYPTSVLINPQGEISANVAGYLSNEQLEKLIGGEFDE